MKTLSFALLAVSAAAFYVSGHQTPAMWLGIAAAAVLIFGDDRR